MLKSGALVLFLAVAASQFHQYQCVRIIGTGSADFSSCPITYFGLNHTVLQIHFEDPLFKVCAKDDNPDCLLLVVPGTDRASVEVLGQGPGLGSLIQKTFHNIKSASPCTLKIKLQDSAGMTHLTFLVFNFGKQSVLQFNPTRLFTLSDLNVTLVFPSNPATSTLYKLSDWKNGVLIDSSGCRDSGLVIAAGKSKHVKSSCSDAVCSPTADLTENSLCRPTEFCDVNIGCVPHL
ncbi:uncharacterized protein [Nothobranchius furzeri]|uniref:LOC107384651-like protein n=1 Tax=Nothobranchius furzeri TaxID=105023 RepID=A0A9D2XT28_NOTFU|nr:putative LOC107384651-like protein [Nothobranchius furzeri]